MLKAHEKNARIMRKYRDWMARAKGADTSTIDQAATAISLFLKSTKGKDFAAFHIEQAKQFYRVLSNSKNMRTGKPLSKATIRSRIMAVKAFFKWLADQPGYKSKISHSDCEYFNLSANETRIATAKRSKPFPSLEQVQHVIDTSPNETVTDKRDRAIIAFTLLTGMRVNALATLPINKVNMPLRQVYQDAREVGTKRRKTMLTYFFPVGGKSIEIVSEWLHYLKTEEKFGESDPLFPKSLIGVGQNGGFQNMGVSREYAASGNYIEDIFRKRFTQAGIPYYHPHSLRNTLVKLSYDLNLGAEQMKAWSQNLSHESLLTTLMSYGHVSDQRTADIMEKLANKDLKQDRDVIPDEVLNWFNQQRKT